MKNRNLTWREVCFRVRLIFPYRTLFKIGFSENNHPLKPAAHILLMEVQLQMEPLKKYNPYSWTSLFL